jgi:phospholipid/cholesterol/gamma-HCH transport system substrate-binding protein
MSNEAKVGLLLVIALAVLGWLTLTSGTFSFARKEPMRNLEAVFNDVNGLKEGTPVRMAGVNIGEVKRIDLQSNGTAVLHFDVRRNVPLPADVAAQVTASGLIGEYYLALVPGEQTTRGEGGLLASNVTRLPTLLSADPTNMSNQFAQMATDIQDITTNVRQVLGNPETTKKFQDIIENLSKFSESLGSNNRQTFDNLNKASANLAQITQEVRDGKGPLGQLLNDDPNAPQLSDTIEEMNKAVKDLRTILNKVNSGQGSLGQLVNDDKTADNLNTALETFNSVAGPLVPNRNEPETQPHPAYHSEFTLQSAYLTDSEGVAKTEAMARLQPGTQNFLQLGAQYDGFAAESNSSNGNSTYAGRDFGNTTKYTAQLGRSLPVNATSAVNLRAGFRNSTPGLGADLLTPRITYSTDIYDFSGTNTPNASAPHLDVSARAHFTPKFYGTIGYDNVLNSDYASPMIGLGLKLGSPKLPAKTISPSSL